MRFLPAALALLATPAFAAEPGTPPIPAEIAALAGCWQGSGVIAGKPVDIRLAARPIVLEAMLAIDVDSRAADNPTDHYAAHILLGGNAADPARVESYFADSFGPAFAAVGQGVTRTNGFDVTYYYAADNMLNRWRRVGDQLAWSIVSQPRAASVADRRTATAAERPFADTSMSRVACGVDPKH